MNSSSITHEFDGNVCKLIISVPTRVQCIENCDIFVNYYEFLFIADVDITRFKCPRRFDIKDMKNIPIAFNTSRREYICRIPCYPDECMVETIEKGELDKGTRNTDTVETELRTFSCITDSCVLTVDGNSLTIKSDFVYGFAGRYRGKHKYSESDLAHICRITNPSILSPIRRTIQRETDETKDFCPDQYKLNFVELQIPDGHENPMKFAISYKDTKLTKDEEYILNKITAKDVSIKLDDEQIDIDCGLISILLAICYDVRCTSDNINCESPWTRTVLSATLSYFERFENLVCVVDSFLRRSLIYPLYRNYDLGRLCVEDTVNALQKDKSWILKQLLVTYTSFIQSERDRKCLNKFFVRDYIRYVANLDTDHLHTLARNLKNVLLNTSKKQLRLGLGDIEMELIKELIEDIHLEASSESDDKEQSSSTDTATESETDSDSDSGSVVQRNT